MLISAKSPLISTKETRWKSPVMQKKKITKLGRDYKQVFICLSLEKPSVLQFQCFRTGIPGCIKQDQQTIQWVS